MSKAPSMPMYWDAYLADTTHFSTEEHGAYLLLLAAMWRRDGTVPDADKDNARITGLTVRKWKAFKVRLGTMIIIENGHITQQNLQKIWKKTQEKIQKNAANGSLGGKAKSNKINKLDQANATKTLKRNPTIPEPEPYSDNKKKEPKGSQKKGTRLSEDWTPSEDQISFARQQGLSDEEIAIEADRFRDHWISKSGQDARKVNWTATWRNWIRSPYRRNNSARPKEQTRSMGALLLERRAKRQGDIHAENGNHGSQFEF